MIEINNISFEYTKNKPVFTDISAKFCNNKISAILGKNGCGKSTLLDCIVGHNDYVGEILIDGMNIKDISPRDLSKLVAYIPQSMNVGVDYTIREFVSFGRNPHISLLGKISEEDNKIIDSCLAMCGIADIQNKDINKVSGGERQLAYIARALTQETPYILMDEPTASLDFGNQAKLFRLILGLQEKGKTIIFTIHNPNVLKDLNCDIFLFSNALYKKKKIDIEDLELLYEENFNKEGELYSFKIK